MSAAFIKELAALLNKHSVENWSNTPDFILAEYLTACLAAWNTSTSQREAWYGRPEPMPSVFDVSSPVPNTTP